MNKKLAFLVLEDIETKKITVSSISGDPEETYKNFCYSPDKKRQFQVTLVMLDYSDGMVMSKALTKIIPSKPIGDREKKLK